MSSSSKSWLKLLESVRADYPSIKFEAGQQFMFSNKKSTVYYNTRLTMPRRAWSLLHELAHASLGHENYSSDFQLLKLEVQAWEKASQLAQKYGVKIDPEHIQNCLDTYRDWLHRRSTCPTCGIRTVQTNEKLYICHNCATRWNVTTERFARPYRLTNQKTP